MDSLNLYLCLTVLHIGIFLLIVEVEILLVIKVLLHVLPCLTLPFFFLLLKSIYEPRIIPKVGTKQAQKTVTKEKASNKSNEINLLFLRDIRNKQQSKLVTTRNFDKNSFLLKNNRIEREVGLELELVKFIQEQSRKKGDVPQSTHRPNNTQSKI
jgi:hypothetical protein